MRERERVCVCVCERERSLQYDVNIHHKATLKRRAFEIEKKKMKLGKCLNQEIQEGNLLIL